MSQTIHQPLTPRTLLTLGTCVLGNMTDGLNILAIAFAAPAISHAWGLKPEAIGLLMSSGLAGVALGSFAIAPLADRYGRRPVAIACLLAMAITMLGCCLAQNIDQMVGLRIITGLGIGGLLPTLNSVVIETAPAHHRNLAISIFSMGYPLGSTLGGLSAVLLLATAGWRAVFLVGGLLTVLVFVLSVAFLPETRSSEHRVVKSDSGWERFAVHFSSQRRLLTSAMSGAFFFNMFSFFFVLSWTPKLVEAMGLGAAIGVKATVLLNAGSLVGGLTFGVLADRFGWKRIAQVYFVLFAVFIAGFTKFSTPVAALFAISFVTGVVMAGAMTSLYSLTALVFPREIRSGGTGLAIAIGRAGAAIGPGVAGLALGRGISHAGLYLLFALPPLLVIPMLRRIAADPQLLKDW